MHRIILAVAFSWLSFGAVAMAAEPDECVHITSFSSALMREEIVPYKAKECIDAQKTLIERLGRKFSAMVDFVRDQTTLVRGINLEVMRSDDGLGPKFTRLYEALAERMGVDRNSDEERFPLVRSLLSDPPRLMAFYSLARPIVRESIKRHAIVGIANEAMEANSLLFKVPLATPVSAGAQEWYENFCYERNDEAGNEEFKEKCAKLDWFEKRFTETYGLAPKADSAKILSFLHRRYREGGMPIVMVWQHMGKDILTD